MFEGFLCFCCYSTENLVFTLTAEEIQTKFSYINVKLPESSTLDTVCRDCIDKIEDFIKFKRQVINNVSLLTSTSPESTASTTVVSKDNGLNAGILKYLQNNKIDIPEFSPKKYIINKLPKINVGKMSCKLYIDCNNIDKLPKIESYNNYNIFKCDNCRKCFKSSENLEKHIKNVHLRKSFVCNICDKEFNNINTLNSHKRFTHIKHLNNFKCKMCKNTFVTEKSLQSHKQRLHNGNRSFECKYCHQKYTKYIDLANHIYRKHNIKYVQCDFCEDIVRERYLASHLARKHQIGKVDTNPKTNQCKICSKTFSRISLLKSHIETHIQNGEFKGNFQLAIAKDSNKKGLLEDCMDYDSDITTSSNDGCTDTDDNSLDDDDKYNGSLIIDNDELLDMSDDILQFVNELDVAELK